MSVMASAHKPREAEEFYKRWSGDVFGFCRLFVGDIAESERIVSQAFLSFYRESRTLPLSGKVPARLIAFAFQAMQPCSVRSEEPIHGTSLEQCILQLDCKQRAIFIARNVLGMEWPEVASATNSAVEDARQSWVRGMLRLREMLPRDFFAH